jgi:hypothetical protein
MCILFLIVLFYLLTFHFCHRNFINFVILLTSMASSKMHSLGMLDGDSDGCKSLMRDLTGRTWRIVVVLGW